MSAPAGLLTHVTFLAGVSSIAGAILWWGALPGSWRRNLALAMSGLGLVLLIAGFRSEGQRESPSTAVFLVGQAYVTEQTSASASLPYYLLTGVCLLLGTLALAVGEDGAEQLGRHWFATATGLSLFVTALRFCLEKVAAPAEWTYAVGIAWLAPLVGAQFYINLREEGRGLGALVRWLLAYALAVRVAVALLMVLASTQALGSHYDVSMLVHVRNPFTQATYDFVPGSFDQMVKLAVVPQLLFWPFSTLLGGLCGAAVAALVLGVWRSMKASGPRRAPLRPPVELSGTHKPTQSGAWSR